MKVAICFYGLVGSALDKNGVGLQLDPKIAWDLNKKNIIDPNNADVFIHSWSYESKDTLEKLYQPRRSLIEPQREFPESIKLVKNIEFKQKIKEAALNFYNRPRLRTIQLERQKEAFRAYSRWYSSQQAIKLKSDYEIEKGFKYDAVMVLRLDVGFYKPVLFKSYDLKKFYASHWNDYPNKDNKFQMNYENHNLNAGFLDFWFFSNTENMDQFGALFNSIHQYHVSPHKSSYQHALRSGFEIDYTLYRWQDHEMIRRKEFQSEK